MIRELCEKHGVTCDFTSKLFFDLHTVSVTVSFPETERAAHANSVIAARAFMHEDVIRTAMTVKKLDTEYRTFRNTFVKGLFKDFPDFPDDTGHRMNKVSVTFYLNSTDMIPQLLAAGVEITKVVMPRNEAEVAYLRANMGKTIREKYYLDQYPYRVMFKPAWDRTYQTEYIRNQFYNGDKIDAERAYYYDASNSQVLYLRDFEDLFLTKVGVSEIIDRIDEVVLSKDV